MPYRCPSTLIIALCLLLAACTPRGLVMGTGASVGTAALQERGLGGATSDYNLRLLMNDALFKDSIELYRRVSFMISNGRIVMIGRVQSEAERQHAQMLAEKAAGRSVVNRLTVGEDVPIMQRLTDSAISARIDASLMFDRDVAAINYDVETIDGVVYVIGESRSESESRRVLYLVRSTSGVRFVEPYFSIPEPSLGSTL